MPRSILGMCAFLALVPVLSSAEVLIDGSSAIDWKSMTGWVQKQPETHSVANRDGNLVFSLTGANTELPWLLSLISRNVSGDERYVLVRYRAVGINAHTDNYFLHGQEGTVGGKRYASSREVKPDGEWHILAVDLLPIEPAEPTHGLGVKLIADAGGKAELEIAWMRFSDDLPESADLAAPPPKAPLARTVVPWDGPNRAEPRPGWTTNAADEHSFSLDGDRAAFELGGRGKGMRWLLQLPAPVDLGALPVITFRYRITGRVDPSVYAIWLGEDEGGRGGNRTIPCFARDLSADGAWHEFTTMIGEKFAVQYLAVGLESESPSARLEIGPVTFSSRPIPRGVSELLQVAAMDSPWPDGKDGFTARPVNVRGGKVAGLMPSRLLLEGWFPSRNVLVDGIPFTVPASITDARQTGTGDLGEVSIDLPAGVSEVYLLTSNTAPATEPWGLDPMHPQAQEWLDVPEKVFCEVRYSDGVIDRMLPLDASVARWGLRRGLGVSVVHPDPTRTPVSLTLKDRMQTASFSILAATMYTGEPRVIEPNWSAFHYPEVRAELPVLAPESVPPGAVTSGPLCAHLETDQGLTWRSLTLPAAMGMLSVGEGPLFTVRVGGRELPAESWTLDSRIPLGAGQSWTLKHAETGLAATISCLPGKPGELLLRMSLENRGQREITADLEFPVLRDVVMGAVADTWYLSGKRGGIFSNAPRDFRDPLGEPHPLQMDGFFNPKSGLALACLTHDTDARHHFVRLSKDETGGAWSCEYPSRDLAPGTRFEATEAALMALPGDWRAIFGAYRAWLATWFRPPARKDWFQQSFAMLSANAHYDYSRDPKKRGDIQRFVDNMRRYIGPCDWVHLFGWAASEDWGDWGDYAHYDETVGGLDYFRGNIRAMQESGVAVSLYTDGYLSSGKGEFVGARAEEWAMRKPDGRPDFIPVYDAYNQCPYLPGWREYFPEACERIVSELGNRVLYIDEYGATDGRWACHARDHGHNGYEIPYAGEVEMLRRIRERVGPDVALFSEYPPAEVMREVLDGSFTYYALWSVPERDIAPHFVNLSRFAFPHFKPIHIIHYAALRSGNWWNHKFPFFNGETLRVGEPSLPGMDEPSLEFHRKSIGIQCEHRAAFGSDDVEALVRTEQAGVFANRFSAGDETVWTLYNANGRTARGTILRVAHNPGDTYEDAWNGVPLTPTIHGVIAEIAVEIGPMDLGCVVRRSANH